MFNIWRSENLWSLAGGVWEEEKVNFYIFPSRPMFSIAALKRRKVNRNFFGYRSGKKFSELRLQKNGLKKEKLRVFSTLFHPQRAPVLVRLCNCRFVYVSAYTKKNIWIFCRRKFFDASITIFSFLSHVAFAYMCAFVRKLWKKTKNSLKTFMCAKSLRLRKIMCKNLI